MVKESRKRTADDKLDRCIYNKLNPKRTIPVSGLLEVLYVLVLLPNPLALCCLDIWNGYQYGTNA
jgi:hypothetical protein